MINVGTKLIAIDKCKMEVNRRNALTLEKEYEVIDILGGVTFIIINNMNKRHAFGIDEFNEFFKII
jgi:hypothetical protein